MNTGEKIKQHRLIKKISPKDIAALLDMDVSNYYRIERDEVKPDIENLIKIAEYLQVDPRELLIEEKMVFNFTSNVNSQQFGESHQPNIYNDSKLAELYEARIKDLEDKIKLQDDKINFVMADNTRLKLENEQLKDRIK